MRRFLVYWLPVLLWAGVIFLVSSQGTLPQYPERWLDTLLKKGAHFLEFAVLAWLLLRALRAIPNRPPGPLFLSLGLALLYAMSDEYHQSFTPNRTPSLVDLTIDALGAAAALVGVRVAGGQTLWRYLRHYAKVNPRGSQP